MGTPMFSLFCSRWAPAARPRPALKWRPVCREHAGWLGAPPGLGFCFQVPGPRRVVVTRFACCLSLGALPHWPLIGASTGPRAE